MKGWKPKLNHMRKAIEYEHIIDSYLDDQHPQSLAELEKLMVKAALQSDDRFQFEEKKPWLNEEIRKLMHERGNTKDKLRRKDLSKRLKKMIRQSLRKWKDTKTVQILDEFKQLDRLQQIGIRHQIENTETKPHPDDFAKILEEIYADS
eukprot:10377786-Karenia_brevis.AAC.1